MRYGIIGRSPSILELYAILDRVADTPTTVLITGESGTGKELVARALHENSSRRDKPFIKVNCAAIPKDLMESELFGYERGAFTGAVDVEAGPLRARQRRARCSSTRSARSPWRCRSSCRARCKRASSSASGGVKTIRVDVRLVAATNQRPQEGDRARARSVKTSSIASTWCRFSSPALRERARTSRSWFEHFIAKFNAR